MTWSGGAPGSWVTIFGSSVGSGGIGGYTCILPVDAGQFTVPSYILLGLPAGSGTTEVANTTNFTSFSATGIDVGTAYGEVSIRVQSTYN